MPGAAVPQVSQCMQFCEFALKKKYRDYINIVHVPPTQAFLQNASLLTEVHVPANLLRTPGLFPIYPPFELKQEIRKQSLPFLQVACFLSLRRGWPRPCCS